MKETLGLGDFDDESPFTRGSTLRSPEEEHAEEITANLAKLLGAGSAVVPPRRPFWAIRRFLEARGRARPVVVVFDDIHWGEPTFLDLVEHVADWSREASILLAVYGPAGPARERPAWAGGKTQRDDDLAGAALDEEGGELIDHLLGSSGLPLEVSDRITMVSEGNPLFVEEMLRMMIDDELLTREGDRWVPAGSLEDVSVPPTISALLSARLDRLSDHERDVLERAPSAARSSTEERWLSSRPSVRSRRGACMLRSLVRRELVGPERSLLPGRRGLPLPPPADPRRRRS